jgi:hypothetical protein
MPQDKPEGKIMVLLDKETFKKLEEFAKSNNINTYGEAVKQLLKEK